MYASYAVGEALKIKSSPDLFDRVENAQYFLTTANLCLIYSWNRICAVTPQKYSYSTHCTQTLIGFCKFYLNKFVRENDDVVGLVILDRMVRCCRRFI